MKRTKWIIAIATALSLLLSFGIAVCAEETGGENVEKSGEYVEIPPTESIENGESVELLPENDDISGENTGNIFEEI